MTEPRTFSPNQPGFLNPSRYWDVASALESESYTDWEGLADGVKVRERILKILAGGEKDPYGDHSLKSQEKAKMVLDLIVHWAYMNEDQGDYIVTESEVKAAYEFALYLFFESSRYVARSVLETDPKLLAEVSNTGIQQQRMDALAKFRQMLQGDAAESAWQNFIDNNTWIFGYGLDYQVLRLVQSQPYYGGRSVDGRGGHRGDSLVATGGDTGFTVLVELKRPSSRLLGSVYRSRTYPPSKELAGGISQLQRNIHSWETEGSRVDANRDMLGHILTVQPKGILVVGRTCQLDDRDKKVSFELIRRNTVNPTIMTFDELFSRAELIVEDRPRR